MRRDFTRHRAKGPKFPGATRRNPANRAKRPEISGAMRRETHKQLFLHRYAAKELR